MAKKKSDEINDIIKKKLDYLGLKSYDEKTYKVYKYVDVNDIDIFLTPLDRIADLKERYKLASPLFTYFDSKSEENIEKFTIFLRMLSNMREDKIEELEEEQKKIKEKLPYEIKYRNNFVWQVYYSDYAEKYFMLVPTTEQSNSALFYLIKEKIKSKKARKKEKIFIPISHLEYSGDFLSKDEIIDVENYLWYFTKEWPAVYEVYDEKEKMSMKIVGTTNVYEKIKSKYSISLNSKQEAIDFYKLLKAMFILSTGIPEEYNFVTQIGRDGNLDFYYKKHRIVYNELSEL